jgi:hypothetical protein
VIISTQEATSLRGSSIFVDGRQRVVRDIPSVLAFTLFLSKAKIVNKANSGTELTQTTKIELRNYTTGYRSFST